MARDRLLAEAYGMTHNPYSLPDDLPAPVDDGACSHLEGMEMPDIRLTSTAGGDVSLRTEDRTVFYVYPKSGRPGVDPPPGWDQMPGMRGCTPQSCAFRDHYGELQRLGAGVYGVSTQTTDEQREFVERLHLPYPLLSDTGGALERELGLPAVDVTDELRVYRRATLVVEDGKIAKVFYPVFPPDEHAGEVASWLSERMVAR